MTVFTIEDCGGKVHPDLEKTLHDCFSKAGIRSWLELRPAPSGLQAALAKMAQSITKTFWPDPNDLVPEGDRLLIATVPTSRFSEMFKLAAPHAKWGLSMKDTVIEYAPPEYRLSNQLHELLHLVGVDDCYEVKGGFPAKPSCKVDTCVMRYGVPTFDICEEVVRQLQDAHAKHAH